MTKAQKVLDKVREGEIDPLPPRKATAHATASLAPASPAPTSSTSLLAIARDATLNPSVDVEKMRAILQMAREEEARQAEREAFSALIDMQGARPRISRDRKSDKHKYATLEKVATELDPLISRHGFAISYGMDDSPLPEHYRITATLMHGHSGWKREYFIDLPSDAEGAKGNKNKTGVQGVGSTISYGRRYLKLMIFDVTIAGEDIDGELPADATPINAKQLEKLQAAIEFKSVNVPKLLEKFGAPSLEEFPRGQFDKAMSLIAQKEVPAPKDAPRAE